MAGIGYELRKLLQRDSLLSVMRAYLYAGVISSGPWVLSIVGMLAIGMLTVSLGENDHFVTQFQVTITYLIAASLMLTGFGQLAFTRFVADRLFEHRADIVVANFNAVQGLTITVSGLFASILAISLFPEQSLLYKVLGIATFVTLSCIWMGTVFLSGIKQYRAIVLLFLIGYGISVSAAVSLRPYGLEGLLGGYLLGQICLVTGIHGLIIRNFTTPHGMRFEVFDKRLRYPTLMWIGLLYNVGAWIDKVIFWYYPSTSQAVIGPLRASVIYDLPVFLAYLSIIPGMAIFLVRIETDFVDHYDSFYSAVREGGSLERIEAHRNGMVNTVRNGIFEIIKIQSIAILLLFVLGDRLFAWLRFSDLYLPLLYVQTIAAGLQVLFLSILTVYFYLDKRVVVLMLCGCFVLGNALLTGLSLALGPVYYGYGFALALLICVLLGFKSLERSFGRLEYSTFMLQ
ncbi:MAG: exopolysaccharide Pel transporter PelG [Burkholderiaceae bacterium]